MYLYPVRLRTDTNGTLLVRFPDVPEAITFGENRGDALIRAAEALEAALSLYMDARREIPRPKPQPASRKTLLVALPALTGAKLALYELMRQSHIRKADLARRLHCGKTHVDRLLDLNHASRLDQLEAAFHALSKRMSIVIGDAA
jgi:antitoxin HicB